MCCQNAFCGGGRYNSLAKEIGAKVDQPSIGASIGIERVLLLLEKKENLPLRELPRLHVVVPLTKEQIPLALLIADELQARNLAADVLVEGDSVKSMMRKANKMGARYVLLIGPEEQQKKVVTVKDMLKHEEATVHQKDLINQLS